MNHKQRPRLGSAITTTILSFFSGVSLVGVDKAQAATLNYSFRAAHELAGGFFKVNNSSLTGIGLEQVAVSDGILSTRFSLNYVLLRGKNSYNLAGATALFYQGDFRGLQARGEDSATGEIIIPPDEPGGPFYLKVQGGASWSIASDGEFSDRWSSVFGGYRELYTGQNPDSVSLAHRESSEGISVSYHLVSTEGEPVPEPLTAGGTALALAGLSWLKHKKKMAA
jgi:hypothetical protein